MSKLIKYVDIYNRLYEDIQSQIYPPNSQLPSENDLAKSMGVSRMTLRKALALLQEDNLITNKVGVGSFVNDPTSSDNIKNKELMYHPIYRCCSKNLDDIVEIDFKIEPASAFITNILKKKSSAIVIANRWYKTHNIPCAYSLSFIPIESISQDNIDLNNIDSLLKYLEYDVYNKYFSIEYTFSPSNTGNFSSKKYNISNKEDFILIQETMYNENKEVILVTKHYIPLDIFKLNINASLN